MNRTVKKVTRDQNIHHSDRGQRVNVQFYGGSGVTVYGV